MRRALIAVLTVLALSVVTAAPAGAQEELGFEINPTEGSPGDVVTGLVNTDDVAEHCTTDIETLQANFTALGTLMVSPGELIDIFFGGDGGLPVTNHDQMAYVSIGLAALGILLDDTVASDVLAQTFVLTFADIETQEPVGERTNFDPNTGFGQVPVPEVAPGLWAVAAACVGPSLDVSTIEAAVRAGGAFLQDIGAPVAHPLIGSPEFEAFAQNFLGSAATGFALGVEFVAAIGADLLAPLMVPDAQGVQTFCVDCEPPPSQDLLDQFCGVLPEIQAVPDQLTELFGGVDIDNAATYPSVGAVEAFVANAARLLELGDTSVPASVAPQWTIATAELRELVFGLTAVGFDFGLLVELSPEEAERILEAARGEGEPDPEFDAAVEVLTAFFADNCGAAPAAPIPAQVRFTG